MLGLDESGEIGFDQFGYLLRFSRSCSNFEYSDCDGFAALCLLVFS